MIDSYVCTVHPAKPWNTRVEVRPCDMEAHEKQTYMMLDYGLSLKCLPKGNDYDENRESQNQPW